MISSLELGLQFGLVKYNTVVSATWPARHNVQELPDGITHGLDVDRMSLE